MNLLLDFFFKALFDLVCLLTSIRDFCYYPSPLTGSDVWSPPANIRCESIPTCPSSPQDNERTEKWALTEAVDVSKLHNRFRYGLNPPNGDVKKIPGHKKNSANKGVKNTGSMEGNVERIVGGVEAVPNSFPWAVAIIVNKAWFCGGSIISSSWVLTAAHCTQGGKTFHLQVGAHNITMPEPPKKLSILSTVAIQHEHYDDQTLANDIALIRLPSPLTFNDYIQPICLSAFSARAGCRTTAVGWGLTSSGGSVSDVLRYVDDLPLIGNDECSDFYGGIINNGTVCADTSGQRGTCQGDSGGVLALQDQRKKWVQVGVTSFGSSRGCEAEYPVGFARVEHYLNWIKNNTNTCA